MIPIREDYTSEGGRVTLGDDEVTQIFVSRSDKQYQMEHRTSAYRTHTFDFVFLYLYHIIIKPC
jgi:hypothetical protein